MAEYKQADNFSQRAARGQAYNLAVMTAIADGKHHDNKYILKQFYRHLEFADMLQNVDAKVLIQAVDNPEMANAIAQLDSVLKVL